MPWHQAEGFLFKKYNKSQECKIAYRYIMYFPFFFCGPCVSVTFATAIFEVVIERWCRLPSVPLITKGKLHIFWFRREWMGTKWRSLCNKLLKKDGEVQEDLTNLRRFKESHECQIHFLSMCWLAFSFYCVLILTLLAWIYLHLLNRLYCINMNVHIILYIGFLS